MAKNTILIDGEKLRKIIEKELNLSIYEIATDNGYSRNIISEAIRKGRASPLVQNLMKLYRVKPEEYIKVVEAPKEEPKQIALEDITPLNREELKALIKEAVKEAVKEYEEEARKNARER